MRVVIAPDSFKECLTAMQVADAIEAGLKAALPDAECIKIPVADGGEGTVQSLVDATGGEIVRLEVTDPLGDPVEAFFGVLGDGETAVIEMAAASGLHLVLPERRDPRVTTTFGTGQLMRAALDRGARRLLLGIGGSATNDGGAGMAQALGVVLLDGRGRSIGSGGGALSALAQIDLAGLDQRLEQTSIEVACDVDNPLTGPTGASAIFGPQKGATPAMIEELDQNLAHFGQLLESVSGRKVVSLAGAGAAGGLGAGLCGFLGASLKPGIAMVLDVLRFRERLQGADLVITGEGRIDSQTIFGKTPFGVAQAAKQAGLPVIAIAGSVADDYEAVHDHGIDAVFDVVPRAMTLDEALTAGAANISRTARNIGEMIRVSDSLAP